MPVFCNTETDQGTRLEKCAGKVHLSRCFFFKLLVMKSVRTHACFLNYGFSSCIFVTSAFVNEKLLILTSVLRCYRTFITFRRCKLFSRQRFSWYEWHCRSTHSFFFIKTHTTVALLIFRTILQVKITLRHGSEIILEYS